MSGFLLVMAPLGMRMPVPQALLPGTWILLLAALQSQPALASGGHLTDLTTIQIMRSEMTSQCTYFGVLHYTGTGLRSPDLL